MRRKWTIVGADDASQLNFLSELNVGSGADALREERRTRKPPEDSDFAEEFLTAAAERHRQFRFRRRRHAVHNKTDLWNINYLIHGWN